MTSLYDLLGARSDDDADALKKAFRNAVKTHHPDLHPDNPAARERFRQIAAAYALLSDASQRAIYDRQLQREREQLLLRFERPQLQRHERRQLRLKPMYAAVAIVTVGAVVGGYWLLSPPLTAAIVATEDEHTATAVAAGKADRQVATVVEMIKDEKQATSAIETIRSDKRTAAAVETIKDDKQAARVIAVVNESKNIPIAVAAQKAEAVKGNAEGNSDNTDKPAGTTGAQVREPTAHKHDDAQVPIGANKSTADKPDDAKVLGEANKPSDDAAATMQRLRDGGDAQATPGRELALDPPAHDASFYRERGIAAYGSGDFLGAIGNFDEAIRLNPNEAQSYNIRGNVWDELGIVERALADYDEAIRIDPNNPAVFLDRAILWQRRGELDKALIDLDRAIRFSFSDVHIYCDRGLVWYEKGRHDRALADFNHAIKLGPDAAAACIKRGLIVHPNSEFILALATAAAGRAIRVDPSVLDALRQGNSGP